MDIEAYKSEIRLKLTGGVLTLELDDSSLTAVINAAFREVQRYIDETKIVTIPFSRCIDMTPYKVNAVTNIYRSNSYISDANQEGMIDPMAASQWQLLSGTGNLYNFSDFAYNYASWNTLMQIRNTTSTDLAFRYDATSKKLYINIVTNNPETITVEYVPRYDDVSQVVSDYWIDVIIRLAVAIAKVTVGRIRSRYKQNNALWDQDGELLLSEGNAELADLREKLLANSQLVYPID